MSVICYHARLMHISLNYFVFVYGVPYGDPVEAA